MIRVILTAPAPGTIVRRELASGESLGEVIEQLSDIFPDVPHVNTCGHLQAWCNAKARTIKAEADYFPPALLVTESTYDWPTIEG